MSARVYFYRNGQELTEHPANGMALRGRGASLARWANKHNHAFGERREALSATDAIEVAKGRTTYALRPNAFDGPVMAKLWWGPKCWSMVAFCTLEDALAAGAVATGHDNNHWAEDGRETEFQGWAPFSEYLAKVGR